jgi:2-dehydropantoate 2-reductase
VTRLIDKLPNDPGLRPVFLAAYKEVIDVGSARDVALPADAVDTISRPNQPDAK